MIDRRSFLERLGLTGGALVLAGSPGWACAGSEQGDADSIAGTAADPLRILILGGTGFIGPHQVEYALSRGHTLTLFNRGRTNTHLFPDVERLVGDRDGDLAALEGREWDVVLDNSGYEPAQVRATAELLAPNTRRYLFVSTQSVYSDRSIIDQDESGAVGMEGVPSEEWEGYGPLKALCESEAAEVVGDRLTVVRPAVIVGPGDRSDRFTSRRERWFWVLASIVVLAIYSTLGLAQVLADRVAEPRTLDHVMFWGAMVVFATILAAGFVTRPRPVQIVAAVGVIGVYWLAFARIASPADRTHLVEYSVVAILIYAALRERTSESRRGAPLLHSRRRHARCPLPDRIHR